MAGQTETDVVLNELEQYGIKGRVSERGKQVAVEWEHAGQARVIFCARTPSDWRGALNIRAHTRRQLRADGVQKVEPQKRVLTLAHALTFPQPTPTAPTPDSPRQADFDALLDLVADLQDQVSRLEARFNNVRVTATVSFDPPQAVSAVASAPSHQPVKAPKAPMGLTRKVRAGGPTELLMGALRGRGWVPTAELIRLPGLTSVKAASNTLSNLKKKGFVENGPSGWRMTADARRDDSNSSS